MICSLLTEGLSLKTASELTGQKTQTLSWARQKIRNGSFSESKEIGKSPNQVPQEEKEWFQSWILELSPVRSGSLNERRIPFSTWTDLYSYYLHITTKKILNKGPSQQSKNGVRN